MNKEVEEFITTLNLFSDSRARWFFEDSKDLIEDTLSIILNKELKVVESHIQDTHIADDELSKNTIFDVYAKDSNGKLYDIEVQSDIKAMPLKRVRYYSSMLDMKLEKGKDYKDLPETYVIVIANTDPFSKNERIYTFDRRVESNGKSLNINKTDESHILFVNGTIKGKEDKLSMLMHDFNCNRSKDMYLKSFKERMKYQESRREIEKMCEKELAFWQPRIDEAVSKTRTKSLEEGKNEGRLQGKTEATLDMVKNMLLKNIDITLISEIANTKVEDILKIRETLLN